MSAKASYHPIPYEVLEKAASWFALLSSQDVDEQLRREWQQWLEADSAHRQAWQQVELVNKQFSLIPAQTASKVLQKSALSRRQLLKNFAVLLLLSGGLYQAVPWQQFTATFSTRRGEIAQHTLEDGTILWLNTASAVQVDFNAKRRSVVLLKGEILVETAKDGRPFYLETSLGHLQALGTRFMLRTYADYIELSVEDGAVAIATQSDEYATIQAGFRVQFDASRIGEIAPLVKHASSWTRNMLIADDLPLADFIDELNRHYAGFINVSTDAADLRLVGAYPLEDIDRVLNALAASHPVTIHRLTPWWRSVQLKH